MAFPIQGNRSPKPPDPPPGSFPPSNFVSNPSNSSLSAGFQQPPNPDGLAVVPLAANASAPACGSPTPASSGLPSVEVAPSSAAASQPTNQPPSPPLASTACPSKATLSVRPPASVVSIDATEKGFAGSLPPAPSTVQGRPSYASVLGNQGSRLKSTPAASELVTDVAVPVKHPGPRFPPIKLPNRQVNSRDGKPSISFTSSEIAACEKKFEHSIIAKFTAGRPSLSDIQKSFLSNWVLTGKVSISDIWDGRYILVILDSEEDVRTVLSSPLKKVGHAFFRLFRWSPDYNPKRESTVTTIWVRLPGLPLSIYDSSFVAAIISTFGFFVSVDDRTRACSSLKYARACVELDVTKPIPDAVWINMPDNKSYWQPIEVEGKLSYCTRCRVHGHSYDQCRKRRLSSRSAPKEAEPNAVPTAPGEVGEDGVAGKSSLDKEASAPLTDQVGAKIDMSKAMVIYEGVVADTSRPENSEIVPRAPVDEGQPSQSRDSPAPTPVRASAYTGPRTLDEFLPFISPYLEEEGIFEIPHLIDASLLEIINKAIAKYHKSLLIPVAAPGDVSPPISEWIPAKKKRKNKGNKVVPSVSDSALRRSSRVRQPTEKKKTQSSSTALLVSSSP